MNRYDGSFARDTADGFRDQLLGKKRDESRSDRYQRGYTVAEQKAPYVSGEKRVGL